MDPFDALDEDDLPALKAALDAGADVNGERDGLSLLQIAMDGELDAHAQTGEPLHVDATALLLARGADPFRRTANGTGTTAEHVAFLNGHWLALELIEAVRGRHLRPPD